MLKNLSVVLCCVLSISANAVIINGQVTGGASLNQGGLLLS